MLRKSNFVEAKSESRKGIKIQLLKQPSAGDELVAENRIEWGCWYCITFFELNHIIVVYSFAIKDKDSSNALFNHFSNPSYRQSQIPLLSSPSYLYNIFAIKDVRANQASARILQAHAVPTPQEQTSHYLARKALTSHHRSPRVRPQASQSSTYLSPDRAWKRHLHWELKTPPEVTQHFQAASLCLLTNRNLTSDDLLPKPSAQEVLLS